MKKFILLLITFCLIIGLPLAQAQETVQWITFEPSDGPGNGQHIVLISGDDEYRSEETMPMLAKILSEHHGFKTTVLFAIDPETGYIQPDYQLNIPGMQHLETADLMILFTRFRQLPDEEMEFFHNYLKAGKPIIGIRTATHAFHYRDNEDSRFAKYDWRSNEPGWEGGFGRKILGETWVDHHGDHGTEGTRALIDGIKERYDHPIIRGVSDIWGPTDVYGTRKLEGDVDILAWGQSTHGMTPDAPVNWEKSIMPIAWTKSYEIEGGETGRVFTTTMGSSVDFESEDLRRLIVNASYWALEMEDEVPERNNVDIVGDYNPTMFGFEDFIEGLTPEDYQ
jgi:hypothetical protein